MKKPKRKSPTRKNKIRKSPTLKKLETRAAELYHQGVQVFKEGVQGLGVMANRTVEFTKIRMENQRALLQMKKQFLELGHRVYDALLHHSRETLRVTPDIAHYVRLIQKLHAGIEKNIQTLKHLTTVDSKKNAARRVKKSSVTQKTSKKKSMRVTKK